MGGDSRGAREGRQAVCRPGSDMPDIPMSPNGNQEGLGPPVSLVSSPWHRFTLPAHSLPSLPGKSRYWLAGICSLKVFLIGDAVSTLWRNDICFVDRKVCA